MTESAGYVTNHSWVRTLGRPDAVDDIADQFERRAAAPPPAAEREAHWPQRSRGWRSIARLHPHGSQTSRAPA